MGPKGRGKTNFSLVDLKDGSKPLTSRGNATTPTAATITIGSKSSSTPGGGEQLPAVKADELSTASRVPDVPSTSLRRPSTRPDSNTSNKTVHARTYGLNGVARYDGTGKLAGGGSSSSPGTAVETVQVAEEEADLNLFDTNFGTPGGPVFM